MNVVPAEILVDATGTFDLGKRLAGLGTPSLGEEHNVFLLHSSRPDFVMSLFFMLWCVQRKIRTHLEGVRLVDAPVRVATSTDGWILSIC